MLLVSLVHLASLSLPWKERHLFSNVLGMEGRRHLESCFLLFQYSTHPYRFRVHDRLFTMLRLLHAFSRPVPHISLKKSGGTTELGKTTTNKRIYAIRDFSAKDAGTYVCTVRNDYGDSSEVTTSVTMLGKHPCIQVRVIWDLNNSCHLEFFSHILGRLRYLSTE